MNSAPLNGRQVPPPSPSEPNDQESVRAHNREFAGSRGRNYASAKASFSSSTSMNIASPRAQGSTATTQSPRLGSNPERRPSVSYSHARQTSKAPTQPRNVFGAPSPSSSPMSPGPTEQMNEKFSNMTDTKNPSRRNLQRKPSKSPAHGSSNGLPHHAPSASVTTSRDTQDKANGITSRKGESVAMPGNRSEHSHQPSNSRSSTEQKLVGNFALHHLFNQFLPKADLKVKQCLLEPKHTHHKAIERICGPGADPTFDHTMYAMAYMTRREPRQLVDTIMFWRQARVRGTQDMGADLGSNTLFSKELQRHLQEESQKSLEGYQDDPMYAESPYHSEFRSTIFVYLTCRVLIEVYTYAEPTALAHNTTGRLVDIIFERLRMIDPNGFSERPFDRTALDIYGQLLGVMDGKGPRLVGQLYLQELYTLHRELFHHGRTAPPKDLEHRADLIIRSMKHLQSSGRPENGWQDTCKFLSALADLAIDAHGAMIKQAYCSVLVDLLFPIASNWSIGLDTPLYREFHQKIAPRVSGMVGKARHWHEAIACYSLLLCASPADHFSSYFPSTLNTLQTKLKDRTTRATALQAICRIVWTYLDRLKDAASATKRLEEIMKIVFPTSKRTASALDPAVCEPLIELIRIIGFHNQEYCFAKIIFPLLNAELLANRKDVKVDQLDPERMVIGIRAFLLILSDVERLESLKPPFPQFGTWVLAIEKKPQYGASYRGTDYPDNNYSAGRPFAASKLSSTGREYYGRFCEVLGNITIICDNAFGGQAVLDEKFSGLTPKTPASDQFSFRMQRDEHQSISEQRLNFYELLHVAVQALPRSLSPEVEIKPLINLLCTCTAHVQLNIAVSSMHSLKAIARQALAQRVTIGFARFIFNFDAQYATMSDEGLLGPDHIESTLSLYLELLQIWIEEISLKAQDTAIGSNNDGSSDNRSRQLDLTSVSNHVDEVESHGVFFLCSQSRRVRAFAVKVLKMITEFDRALGRPGTRVINILEGDAGNVMDIDDDSLTVAERSRLQKDRNKTDSQSTLVELSSSDISYDATLWLKVFPNIIRLSFEACPLSVIFGRDIVCARLVQMQETITFLDVGSSPAPNDIAAAKATQRLQSTSPQIIIEQWKLYLIMACTTVTNAGAQTQSQLDKSQHARKISKPAPTGKDKISSARSLFAYVIPLLSANSAAIRDAIVLALSSINTNLYRILLESLQYAVTSCKEEAKKRMGPHQRSGSNPRKTAATDRMRTEVTQIYRLTARFLQAPSILQDEWIVSNLSTYTRELMIFLGDADVQNDWDSQKLKRQFCGLVEELSNGVNQLQDPSRYISFEFRRSAFALMEDWCGHSPYQATSTQRDNYTQQMLLPKHSDPRPQGHVNPTIEAEKRDLSVAALSAMATLCAGPIKITTDRGEILSFDNHRMLSWIDRVFSSQNDKVHVIGQRALKNLIEYNLAVPTLLTWSVEQCFHPDRPRALDSYFTVAAKVLYEHETHHLPFWKILATLLILLGNEKSEIRLHAVKLLQHLEVRRHQKSGIRDFDINISDRTTAVHKNAAYEISSRLAKTHSDLAFFVFSQFARQFKIMHVDTQRQMVSLILPWIQMIELQIDTDGNPTPHTYMVLANLLEITNKTSSILHNEMQALWQSLATGHPGNVQLVLDFVIALCSERKDQGVVYYTKQIIVYMAHGAAGSKVVEYLLMKITPKNMVHTQKDYGLPTLDVLDSTGLPYTAELSDVFPSANKTDTFALAHLAVIFLVDLIVKPMTIKGDQVPLLLHVIFVLWDHQIALVHEQARELLVHLIHELVITKIPPETQELYVTKRKDVENFVDAVRHHESSVIWQYREKVAKYEDWNADPTLKDDERVPKSMPNVTDHVISIFGLVYPQIRDSLARTSLGWGTSCPVRHAACRSLQVFRCVLVPIDRPMLSDILARISNTIVHEANDVQAFSMEMLTTVKSIIDAMGAQDLLQYPHLFWTTCACLDTVIENEFVAALGMLEKMIPKLNFEDPAVIKILDNAKPKKWHGLFEGLTPLVYKGLKSATSMRSSLMVLEKLIDIPDNELIGNQSRLLFVTLATLPCLMQTYEGPGNKQVALDSARTLAAVADRHNQGNISLVLLSFCNGEFAHCGTFLDRTLGVLREIYFPMWELKAIIFVIGLLTNTLAWYKVQILQIVKALLTDVDAHRHEISDYGMDLISPLLRLLQTEFCPQAVAVLDHVKCISETPLTKQHMRMSMTGLGNRSLSVRKEYERTQSLYGIPEGTGWSIPVPGIHSSSTRSNMALIYQECANPSVPAVEAEPTPEVEFHPEEEHEQSYFALDRNDGFSSQEHLAEHPMEGGMSDLLMRLNSFDDFFDESLDVENDPSIRYSSLTVTPYNLDTGAQIYDQETAPILQHTLARTTSISSMHNHGLERSRVGPMHPVGFTPSADAAHLGQSRPPLHSRSVTSPANNIPHVGGALPDHLTDDDADDGIFSEDERSTGHITAKDSRLLGSTSLRRANTTLRRAATAFDPKEPGQKSLLRSLSRSHAHKPRSPSVPKVPEAYRR